MSGAGKTYRSGTVRGILYIRVSIANIIRKTWISLINKYIVTYYAQNEDCLYPYYVTTIKFVSLSIKSGSYIEYQGQLGLLACSIAALSIITNQTQLALVSNNIYGCNTTGW